MLQKSDPCAGSKGVSGNWDRSLAFASIRNFFDGRAAILAKHPELTRAVLVVADRDQEHSVADELELPLQSFHAWIARGDAACEVVLHAEVGLEPLAAQFQVREKVRIRNGFHLQKARRSACATRLLAGDCSQKNC